MKGVIHHLGNPNKAFKEAKRVLVSGGTLIIFEGIPSSKYRKIVLKIADLLKVKHESSLFPHLSGSEISTMLVEAGFSMRHEGGISGFFTPLGLSGFGGEALWRKLNYIEDMFQDKFPLFMWHNFIAATISK